VTNDSLRASAQDLPQVDWLGKSSAHISPNPRLAYQRVLRLFSILDIEGCNIPSIDPSLLVEQRIAADQEPAVFAGVIQRAELIFELSGSVEGVL